MPDVHTLKTKYLQRLDAWIQELIDAAERSAAKQSKPAIIKALEQEILELKDFQFEIRTGGVQGDLIKSPK